MNKREYAISLGLANPGRGRMSKDAHDAIAKAEAEGMSFDENSPQNANTVVAETFERYRPHTMFSGRDSLGGMHTVDSRQACCNCGYSLVGHICNNPTVLVVIKGHGMETISVKPVYKE